MRRLVLLAALGLAALGAPAAAQRAGGDGTAGGTEVPVSIGFDRLSPVHVDVVAGDTVMWANNSARVHTVTADDLSFDSRRVGVGRTFAHRFDALGEVAYHCALHPFIRGTVAVHDLLLEAPPAAASPNRPFVLRGRASSAPAAGTVVSLEADSGAGFAPVSSATLGDDRTFTASFVPTANAVYRAVAGSATSPPVELLVLDRRVAVSTRQRAGRRTVVQAAVAPASRGGHVVLQLFLPERFGWWPVQRRRLDARSGARFTVRTKRRLQARVVLTLPDGATRLAVSRTVHVGPRG